MRKLLLISNSTNFGSGYLDHCLEEILEVVGTSRLLFVPFALSDRTGYTAKFRSRLVDFGIEVEELAADRRAPDQIEAAEAIFVGGGNTFRLLKMLYDTGALAPLRERVAGGIPYLGASAGTNVA